jgi:PAS domain S-box-containing protein
MPSFEETKNLLDNSTIFYLISVDMNGTYSYLNKRYSLEFDQIHGNLIGQNYAVTMHPDDLEVCRTVSEQCFRYPDRLFPAIIRKHDGKGGFIITQWEYKAMFDQNNAPSGVFCIGHDITEFQKTTSELESTKDTLNDAKLTLSQIKYAQSHIVRKPLANIIGLSQLLDAMDLDPSVKSISSMISDSARELDDVIKTSVNPKNGKTV